MIYVMSDIHGNSERFNNIMQQINFGPGDTLYILGDVIDRFPDGIAMLRKIMKTPNIKMLLGNHEYMMLEALYHPVILKREWWNEDRIRADRLHRWYRNGGEVTHNNLKRIGDDASKELFEYLDNLPLNINVTVNGQKYILAHGGVVDNYDPSNNSYNDKTDYAVWSRQSRYETIPDDTILIFGHTPTSHFQAGGPLKIWRRDNYIGIDCGCGYDYPGRLCCLRLDDMQVFYSSM